MDKNTLKDYLEFKDEFLQPLSDKKLKILEIGSRLENSSILLRDQTVNENWEFIGLDINAGRNVDVVSVDPYKYPFDDGSFDVIISSNTLEHIQDMKKWMKEVSRISKGLVWILCPNSYEEHGKFDYWRVFPAGMRYLLGDIAGLEVINATKSDYNTIGVANKISSYIPNDIPGWMLPADQIWLHETASVMDSVIEVGSWKGRSTHALLSGCSGTVHAIDHFLGSRNKPDPTNQLAKECDVYTEFMKNVGDFNNLEVFKNNSLNAASYFVDENESADMVFIDASHKYDDVCADIKAWLPMANKIISGHDWDHLYVRKAVNDMLGDYDIKHVKNGTIWYIKLNNKK